MLTLVWYLVAYIILSFVFRGLYLVYALSQQCYPRYEEVVAYVCPAVFLLAYWITTFILYGG